MNLRETDYQLKYFFHIDTDIICQNIIDADLPNKTTTDFLDGVFKEIFISSAPYNNYIHSVTNIPKTAFFNETISDAYFYGLSRLMYLALQNNCILYGFFHELNTRNEYIDIRANNSSHLKAGLFYTKEFTTIIEKERGDALSQIYNNYFKRFNKNKGYYSSQLIQSLSSKTNQDNNIRFTQKHLGSLVHFLLEESEVSKFSAKLLKPTKSGYSIFSSYENLYQTCSTISYKEPLDSFLFETELENMFGFSYIHFISNLYNKIHFSAYNETHKTIKDLEGQQLIKLLYQAANLPLYYNQSLFLRYAFDAFENSTDLYSNYLEMSPIEAMTLSSPLPSRAELIGKGIILMDKFFKALTKVTIPLLYSLWIVVADKLKKTLSFDKYIEYIKENINSIQCNYALFDETSIRKHNTVKSTYNNYLLTNETVLDYNSMNLLSSFSGDMKSVIENFIQYFCNFENFKSARQHLIFEDSNMRSSTLLTNIISPINVYSSNLSFANHPTDAYSKSKSILEETYIHATRNALLSYVTSKDENI